VHGGAQRAAEPTSSVLSSKGLPWLALRASVRRRAVSGWYCRKFVGDNPAADFRTLKIAARQWYLVKDELPRLFEALAKTPHALGQERLGLRPSTASKNPS
jgi:hypothetical protein